jgi:hypothetical protein
MLTCAPALRTTIAKNKAKEALALMENFITDAIRLYKRMSGGDWA